MANEAMQGSSSEGKRPASPFHDPMTAQTKRRNPYRTANKATKRVYFFSDGKAAGNAGMTDLLGEKGACLAELSVIPLPVPPGQ